ncbi:hypothetical protein EMWEY_00059510 [Eimeria maxima]|uniref:Uncharacterized protein n=1 Tax=Eimeria maxima TaxID=5804 RepID=U6M6X6_EIMMA|nr:hypothetical protein EMWEY_00059510 [Eimeria maxima]CDJ59972.1 hypothetical protein EMWEY_00059510 [Eimeria maxima]
MGEAIQDGRAVSGKVQYWMFSGWCIELEFADGSGLFFVELFVCSGSELEFADGIWQADVFQYCAAESYTTDCLEQSRGATPIATERYASGRK